jgi:hypothetical protein
MKPLRRSKIPRGRCEHALGAVDCDCLFRHIRPSFAGANRRSLKMRLSKRSTAGQSAGSLLLFGLIGCRSEAVYPGQHGGPIVDQLRQDSWCGGPCKCDTHKALDFLTLRFWTRRSVTGVAFHSRVVLRQASGGLRAFGY